MTYKDESISSLLFEKKVLEAQILGLEADLKDTEVRLELLGHGVN